LISLVLITGFLGSGKTTFLRHIDETNSDKKIVFLVNDFSAVDIDYQILSKQNDNVISVAGGSIFCKCLVTEFVSQLKLISGKFPDTDIVVIEASGIANPSTFKTMLIETKLNEIYSAEKVITIVDPQSLPVLYHTLQNIKNQISLADMVILNKIDVATKDQIDSSMTIINKLNSHAPIIKTNYCELDFNPISIPANSNKFTLENISQKPQSQFGIYSYRQNKPVKLERLYQLIKRYNSDIYRIKGFIAIDSSSVKYIDYDGSKMTVEDSSSDKPKSLEFIFDKSVSEEIKKEINCLNK